MLKLSDGVRVPELTPMHEDAERELKLPPLSYGYYVFMDARAKACMGTSYN